MFLPYCQFHGVSAGAEDKHARCQSLDGGGAAIGCTAGYDTARKVVKHCFYGLVGRDIDCAAGYRGRECARDTVFNTGARGNKHPAGFRLCRIHRGAHTPSSPSDHDQAFTV